MLDPLSADCVLYTTPGRPRQTTLSAELQFDGLQCDRCREAVLPPLPRLDRKSLGQRARGHHLAGLETIRKAPKQPMKRLQGAAEHVFPATRRDRNPVL